MRSEETENTNIETRNPKQIGNPKIGKVSNNSIHLGHFVIRVLNLFRISSFGFPILYLYVIAERNCKRSVSTKPSPTEEFTIRVR